jgi:hypothetical protein
LIGKRNYIKKKAIVCTKHAHRRANSYKIVGKTEAKLKEAIKSVTLSAVENPHTLDQSNKELANFSRSWSVEHSTSSKVLLLCSSHTVHIKQRGAKFQISEWCVVTYKAMEYCPGHKNSYIYS